MGYYIVIVYIFLAVAAEGAYAGSIRVTLFGQPCKLEGPLDPAVLKAVHAVSPEQASPGFSAEDALKPATAGLLKGAVSKVSSASAKKIPASLDRYREKLVKHLESQAAFAVAVQAAVKSRKPGSFLKALPAASAQKPGERLETLARKLETEKGDLTETVNQLFDAYSEGVEPDPEEEFHRTIRKMGIKYVCSFEESGTQGQAAGEKEDASGD
jgi:hypothetical protein